ncbi:hypothetical protein HPP92_012194 [Vanilla planifolia]|uniref:Uncharacterized protein n=1 Tax=Vanilla planifolia TaxID=51239 RepID=A0A835R9Y2_VANPL|nr:hypothetical protein HPP92_012194 [Vanilla planifolia]
MAAHRVEGMSRLVLAIPALHKRPGNSNCFVRNTLMLLSGMNLNTPICGNNNIYKNGA